MTIGPRGIDLFAVSMIEHGASQLVFPGMHEPETGNATMGISIGASLDFAP